MTLRIVGQILIWGGYSSLGLILWSEYVPVTASLVLNNVVFFVGMFGSSELLRNLALRRGWLDEAAWKLFPRIILFAPLCACGVEAVTLAMLRIIALTGSAGPGLDDFNQRLQAGPLYIFNSSLALWLWSAVWLSWQYVTRYRQERIAKKKAEEAQRELELEVLKAQINPHFIFNALNNVRAMIHEDTDKARDMITRLSNILRRTVYQNRHNAITVAEEIAVVRDYIALEQIHYEDRLQVIERIAADAFDALMPPMILQLLVENAVKHGVAKTAQRSPVTIDITRADRMLWLRVGNAGLWQNTSEPGIGLQNLRNRLAHAGGQGAVCDIDTADGLVAITVGIPQ